jgi:LynF/TruF/PatF family peptide O-prenyltransferase
MSTTQVEPLSEQRLRFIKAHQAAFEVEPLYPLEIFEDFVVRLAENCTIETSCKIESEYLIASRFMLFFFTNFEENLTRTLTFFDQIGSRADVNIDYSLLDLFLEGGLDFDKVKSLSNGVDLRRNLADSSLKMHLKLSNYPEKIKKALDLYGDRSDPLISFFLPLVSLIGFDFYFDGHLFCAPFRQPVYLVLDCPKRMLLP